MYLSYFSNFLSFSVPVQRPTVVQMAKSMLRAVDPDDKASVRGVGTLDLDGIVGNEV